MNEQPASEARGGAVLPEPPGAPHILVIEDEPIISAMLACLLEDAGYLVTTADNGAEALTCLKTLTPALIVTDFMMPLMTGLDLAKAVRSDERLRDIPIILISGLQGSVGRQHPDLFQSVLDKPCRPEALIAEIENALANAKV